MKSKGITVYKTIRMTHGIYVNKCSINASHFYVYV